LRRPLRTGARANHGVPIIKLIGASRREPRQRFVLDLPRARRLRSVEEPLRGGALLQFPRRLPWLRAVVAESRSQASSLLLVEASCCWRVR